MMSWVDDEGAEISSAEIVPTETAVVAAKQPKQKAAKPKSAGRSSSTLSRLIREAEKDIARLDRRKTKLTEELVSAGADHAALSRIGAELAEVETGLAAAEESWLALSEESEG